MKAKLIRATQKIIRDRDIRTGKKRMRLGVHPVGTIINGPKAWLLCLQGVAVPADAECRRRVPMTDGQIEAAMNAYEKIDNGIQPVDYDAYDRGLMVGYKPDGKKGDEWKPGPNWTEGCEADYYSYEEEEDDDE